MFKTLTKFGIGVIAGLYIDQNYSVPDINLHIEKTLDYLKKKEDEYRKDNENYHRNCREEDGYQEDNEKDRE